VKYKNPSHPKKDGRILFRGTTLIPPTGTLTFCCNGQTRQYLIPLNPSGNDFAHPVRNSIPRLRDDWVLQLALISLTAKSLSLCRDLQPATSLLWHILHKSAS